MLPRNHNPYQSDVNRIFRPPCGLFPPVNKPEIVNYLIPKHPGGTNHLPRRTQQNIVILLRSFSLYISYKSTTLQRAGSYFPFCAGSTIVCTYTVCCFCCVGNFRRCFYAGYSFDSGFVRMFQHRKMAWCPGMV